MKLGLSIGYSGAELRLPVDKVLLAERLGFDSVWTAEAYGSDAITPLAYLAALTKRIRLGTGIMQLAARPPASAAMAAGTLDALAGGGRVIAGLGVSGPQIVEGWYGQPWGKPSWRARRRQAAHDHPAHESAAADLARHRHRGERETDGGDRRRVAAARLRAAAHADATALARGRLSPRGRRQGLRRLRDPGARRGRDHRRRARGARAHEAARGALRRRHGASRQELPQGDDGPPRLRRRGAAHPGALSGEAEGRGRRRRSRRVLRRDVAGRAGRAHPRALPPLGRLRNHRADDHDRAARGDGADGKPRSVSAAFRI